jgi:hypothetical protein
LSEFPIARAAAGCNPYVTPWGMLQPVSLLIGPPFQLLPDALTNYPNHYSFVQTAENHGAARRIISGLDELIGGELPSLEESRAIMSPDVYKPYYPLNYQYAGPSGLGLVSNLMRTLVYEHVRGPKVEFDLFHHHYKWYIWKRTYHWLKGTDINPTAQYVYSYVN